MTFPVNFIGTLGADVELRFSPSGDAIASMRIVTERRYKDASGDWKSKDESWWQVTAWRQLAENAAESLKKGDRVVVVGDIKQRSYDTREGEKRTVTEVEARSVAPDLARATASVTKVQKQNQPFDRTNTSLPDDPWATNQTAEAPF